MKAIIVGGAAVNAALQSQIQQLSVPVFSTYGMTETVSHIAIKRLNKESISDEFEILDGVEIKLDERSCLAIKAPASNNEWIFTNDVVELTEDKKFKILGRYDNIINSGGVKIQLEEVEKVVLEICKKYFEELSNKRFFAWGIPDDKLGQKLVLIWETNQITKDEKSILEKCAEKLPKFKIPKAIFLVNTFIETPSGKIDKRVIAQSLLLDTNS
jgi:O-succinylbenzoic acid--CoA ligase